jgi:hypothetical protein
MDLLERQLMEKWIWRDLTAFFRFPSAGTAVLAGDRMADQRASAVSASGGLTAKKIRG